MQTSHSPGKEEQQMRSEVLALREALENLEHARHTGIAGLQAQHRAELEELQSTIRHQREVMDGLRARHEEALQQLRRQLQSEIRELQTALVGTRTAFDAERLALQSRHQQELLAASRIRTELEATVRQLRERIDDGR